MLPTDILLPVFVHVALVYVVLLLTVKARNAARVAGKVKLQDTALDETRWPDEARKPANNYRNQFELPILFYALVAILLATSKVDLTQVVLAWIFVASRILHTYIHVGSNRVDRRGLAFVVGASVLAVMWIWFGLRLYFFG